MQLPTHQFGAKLSPAARCAARRTSDWPNHNAKQRRTSVNGAQFGRILTIIGWRPIQKAPVTKMGADLLVPPIDDGFGAAIDNFEISRHCE